MNIGSWLLVIGVGLFLLLLLFLPKITGKPTDTRTKEQREADSEAAYRRGFMLGSLMEEARETNHANPQQAIEQAVVEQMVIEHLQQQRKDDAAGNK